MKTLYELLMDNYNTLSENADPNSLDRMEVEKWINENYSVNGVLDISKKPNKDNKYVVSCNGTLRLRSHSELTHLTNGMFIFKNVTNFFCQHAYSLETLEGAPTECKEFWCSGCNKLKDLVGSPKKVIELHCDGCFGLKTLKGCSRFAYYVYCDSCHGLESLEGAPRQLQTLSIEQCYSLKKANIKKLPKSIATCYSRGCGYSRQDILNNSQVGDFVN